MESHFDMELDGLKQKLLTMASHAETSVQTAIRALTERNDDLALEVIEKDSIIDQFEIEMDELAPVAEAMERGGRLAAKAEVTDAILDKCKPIAGTPADCIAAIEEYRDAGCTHVMLELWGDRRHDQIRLFGEKVLPQVRG